MKNTNRTGNSLLSDRQDKLLFFFILAVGCFIRLWKLGSIPSGVHQDEAYAGYEAFCLLHDGRDSWGCVWPVYFISWGSGMNILGSILMLPFVALFGLCSFAIRMPQAILACLSLPAFYVLLSSLWDKKTGLIGMALLAICPWHILLARWGMESNLAPALLLFGITFFALGLKKPAFHLLSALFFGLALYSYAVIWLVVPSVLLLLLFYLLYVHGLPRLRLSYLFLLILILFLMALPLFLFLLVNYGILPKITTPFFSIPRLQFMRDTEMSLGFIKKGLLNVLHMLIFQEDGETFNNAGAFGICYFLSLPFFLIGFARLLRDAVLSLKKRLPDGSVPILIFFFIPFFTGCLTDGDIIRINALILPFLVIVTCGIRTSFLWMKKHFPAGRTAIIAAYALLFLCFSGYYFGNYAKELELPFQSGLSDALSRAEDLTGSGKIHVSSDIEYPRILFWDQTDPEEFRSTILYQEMGQAFLQPVSFTRFVYDLDGSTPASGVLLLSPYDDPADYPGYTFETYGVITVAWK